jgi:hypothetical protein
MKDHKNTILQVELGNEIINYPAVDILDKEYFFYPFYMNIGSGILKTALATPLCTLNERKTYVFYSKGDPCYDLEGDIKDCNLITLNREEAENAWKVILDKEYLILSDSAVIQSNQGIEVIGRQDAVIEVYPAFEKVPDRFEFLGMKGLFQVYERKIKKSEISVSYEEVSESEGNKTYEIHLDYQDKEIADCYLQINYEGDGARLYLKGECIADHFYHGLVWEIGLKRFYFPSELRLEVSPLAENALVFLEKLPEFDNGTACKVTEIKVETEYVTIL